MYGNGVRTGTAVIVVLLRPILQVLRVGLAACFAVAAGTSTPGSVARLFVAAALQTTRATSLASALSSPSNNLTYLKSVPHSEVLSKKRKNRNNQTRLQE